MRKIEKRMLKAIENKENFRLSNTGVFYEDVNTKYGPRSEVYLWGNHIGDYWHDEKKFDVNIRTLLEWPSVTTISRLRALGVDVQQKNWKLYIDGKEIGQKRKFSPLDGMFIDRGLTISEQLDRL
jgi:hypothetical protein